MAPKADKKQKQEAAEEPERKGGKKKASKVAKAVKASVSRKTRKVRKNVHFFRPKTLIKKRDPKYPTRSVQRLDRMDKYRVIRYPVTTESAMKKIEEINTLVFIVDIRPPNRKSRKLCGPCTT